MNESVWAEPRLYGALIILLALVLGACLGQSAVTVWGGLAGAGIGLVPRSVR